VLDLCLINCKLELGIGKVCLGIKKGKIVSIKRSPASAHETLDLRGKLVLPGLIDSHVHFRDPGLTYKEDFRSGSTAAAAGGFTTVLDMPNNIPPTSTPQAFLKKRKIAEKKSLVDFGLHAGVVDPHDIGLLAELRPVSFKIFMDLVDTTFLQEASVNLSGCDLELPLSLHPEDPTTVHHYTRTMKKEGDQTSLYAQARPPEAEDIAVAQAIAISKKMKQKIHLCHLSTIKSYQMTKNAQNNGLPVSFEVTPHHLFLDASYLERWGNLAKTNPPLRDHEHKLGITELAGIDIIATDHAPHTLEEKNQDVWNAPPGVPGLETALPLLLTLVNQGKLSLNHLKRILCENPARIFNIPHKGFLKEGMDADLVVVDLAQEGVINSDKFHSKAKYSPFEGFKVQGMPVMTLVRGNVVMEEGNVLENKGKFIYSQINREK
jgi:dihydroorotase